MTVFIPPVGPDAPPGLAPLLMSIREAVLDLANAVRPSQIYACALLALPPPADWAGCVLRVTDLNILAVSNGAAWIRQDTGAAI